MGSVTNWVLSVELDGEWEECSFATRPEAMAAFIALASDYSTTLRSVVLAANPSTTIASADGSERPVRKTYVN